MYYGGDMYGGDMNGGDMYGYMYGGDTTVVVICTAVILRW